MPQHVLRLLVKVRFNKTARRILLVLVRLLLLVVKLARRQTPSVLTQATLQEQRHRVMLLGVSWARKRQVAQLTHDTRSTPPARASCPCLLDKK